MKLSGRAALATDPDAVSALLTTFVLERRFQPPAGFDLFNIDIESIAVISVTDDQLVIDRWSITEGRRTVRRS